MFASSGAQTLVRLAGIVLLARLLAPADFGLMGAAMVVIGLSTFFSQLGMGPALIQRSELESRHLRTAMSGSVVLGFALAGLLFLLAPAVSALFRFDELTSILQVSSVVFPIQGFALVSESMMRRGLMFRRLAMIQAVSYAVGYVGVSVVLAWQGFGVWSLVAGTIAWRSIASALAILKARPPRPGFDIGSARELLTYGGGFTLAKLFNYTALQGDFLVAGRFLGAVALGLYNRAYHLLVAPVNLIASAIDDVLFPVMASTQDRPDRLRRAFAHGEAAIGYMFLPISVFVVVLAPELVLVTLGSQWAEVTLPLQILALGMFFRAAYKIGDSLARATGAVYRRAWRQGVYAAAVLIGASVGQHLGGLRGLSVGVLLALVVNFTLMAHLSLGLTDTTWSTFLRFHGGPLRLTLVVALLTVPSALALRNVGLDSLTLLLTMTIIFALPFLVAWHRPELLGESAVWMRDLTRKSLPSRLRKRSQFDPKSPVEFGAEAAPDSRP
jgi:PST family polysaccharide transporter